MKIVTLSIEGMHCEGCAHIVEHALDKLDGVQTSTVSYKHGTGRVLFNPNRVTQDQLGAAIRKAGYEVAESKA